LTIIQTFVAQEKKTALYKEVSVALSNAFIGLSMKERKRKKKFNQKDTSRIKEKLSCT